MLQGISFFTAPMFASLLPEEEYGKLTVFFSYQQLVVIFATWEIGLGPYQRGLFKYKDNLRHFTSSAILFSNILSILLFLIVLLFIGPVSEFTQMPFSVIALLFFYSITNTAYVCWMTRKKVEYDYKKVSIMTLLLACSQIIIPLLAVIFTGRTAEVRFIYTLIPAILIFFIIYVKEFRFGRVISDPAETKKHFAFLISFTIPLVIHSLSYMILGQMDRIMISKMVGDAEAGLYGVAYTIASIASIVQSSVLQAVSPWIYNNLDRENYSEIRNKASGLLIFVSAVFIVFILIAPDVILLMYPSFYWDGIWCIPPVSLGIYFIFMYSLFVNVETFLDQTKYVAVVSVFCAALNILLNFFGIKIFGYIACAYTTLFCYIIFALGHYFFMRKVTKEKNIKESIYNAKLFLLISLSMLIITVGITLIYNFVIIRYAILLLTLFVCFIMRKKITGVVKSFIKK